MSQALSVGRELRYFPARVSGCRKQTWNKTISPATMHGGRKPCVGLTPTPKSQTRRSHMNSENQLWTRPLGPCAEPRKTLFVVNTVKNKSPNVCSMAKIILNSRLTYGRNLRAMASRLEHVQGKGYSIVHFDGSRGREYSINTRC